MLLLIESQMPPPSQTASVQPSAFREPDEVHVPSPAWSYELAKRSAVRELIALPIDVGLHSPTGKAGMSRPVESIAAELHQLWVCRQVCQGNPLPSVRSHDARGSAA